MMSDLVLKNLPDDLLSALASRGSDYGRTPEEEAVRILRAELGCMRFRGVLTRKSEPLTAEEKAALRRGGIDLDEVPPPRNVWNPADPGRRWVERQARLIRASLPVMDVPLAYGLEPAIVEELLDRRVLYWFSAFGDPLVPSFNFLGPGRLYPGAEQVFPAIPLGMDPVEVWIWWELPTTDLREDGECGRDMSPEEWLRRGLSPEPVADLAKWLGCGL